MVEAVLLFVQRSHDKPQSLSEDIGSGRTQNTSGVDDMADQTREEVDAKISASEARTETKIARLEGKLDLVLSKLDHVAEDNRSTRANQWVIAFGLAVLIVGVAALFPVFFGMGAQLRDMVRDEVVNSTVHAPQPPTPTVPPAKAP